MKQPSNRVLAFQALAANPQGLSSSQLGRLIGLSPGHGAVGIILRGEQYSKRIRVEIHDISGRDSRRYFLTAQGLQDLGAGRVDSEARRLHLVAHGRSEITD